MRELEQRGVPFTPLSQARVALTVGVVAWELNLPEAHFVKPMIVRDSANGYNLFVIPGDRQLSLKKVAGVLNDKKVELAPTADVERITGF
jgi:prolyl-tRNA editing enzyme YbaK/EbsC (Cys-tRNA(Pro) deacylase)